MLPKEERRIPRRLRKQKKLRPKMMQTLKNQSKLRLQMKQTPTPTLMTILLPKLKKTQKKPPKTKMLLPKLLKKPRMMQLTSQKPIRRKPKKKPRLKREPKQLKMQLKMLSQPPRIRKRRLTMILMIRRLRETRRRLRKWPNRRGN
jgi:hypothetical protein